ncbi:MAG: NADH-quinone oxidoreductase subunit C [Syntrophorhabdus sp.]
MIAETQEIILLEKEQLMGFVARFFAEGYRLVQIGCSTLKDAYELNYSFDRDYRFTNLRVCVGPKEEVPSISMVYENAFLYENEIHDLFGVPITNISIDYGGTLYRTALKNPFSVENVKLPEKPKAKTPPGEKPDTEKEKPPNVS